MKSLVIVVLLAVGVYFLLRPTTFVAKSDIFMYKSPSHVYTFMSDLKRTIEKHSSIGGKNGKCTLLKQRTRQDGVQEKLFLVEKAIPIWRDYVLPFNLEIRLTLLKPNKELVYNSSFLRGYLLKVYGRMTFEAREGRVKEGTFLTEELTITCPWLTHFFIKNHLEESQKDTLISLRNGLESMPVSRDKETPGGERDQGGQKKTQKKEPASSEKKKAKKDETKESSDRLKQKAAETSGKHKQGTAKEDIKPVKKEERSASKDTDTKKNERTTEPKVGEKKQDGSKTKKDAASQTDTRKDTERKDGGQKVEKEVRKEPRNSPKEGKNDDLVEKGAKSGKVKREDSKSEKSKESEPTTRKSSEKPKAEKVAKPVKVAPKNTKNGG